MPVNVFLLLVQERQSKEMVSGNWLLPILDVAKNAALPLHI